MTTRFAATVIAIATALPLLVSCKPQGKTVLSANTVRTQRGRAVAELIADLKRSGYACTEQPVKENIVLECQHSNDGSVAVEIRTDTQVPAVSMRYWVENPRCGGAELLAEMESFNLDDRAGGTKVYCVGEKMVLEYESFLPGNGVEATEVGTLVAKWVTSAANLLQNSVLLSGEGTEDGEEGGVQQ